VRDLTKIPQLLEAAVKAGSNQVNGIFFRIADREAVMANLRAKAFDAARAKADAYARRAGMALGPVTQITENDPLWVPPPSGIAYEAAPAPAARSMPVSEGRQEVSLFVTVVFELRSKM
jgi:uncharacterized protein YggE